MKKISNWLWCFPQNLIGFVIHIICKAKGRQTFKHKDAIVTVYFLDSGGSFGNYIFIPLWAMLDSEEKENYVKHEYGHTLQSRKLGWLYFIIVFTPSLIWNACFRRYRKKHNVDYYSFFIEKWADRLGGVTKRKEQIVV